ncbi:MAG: asparagine synthase-related protein [Methanolinea sp.]|jgi:predicted subunit of tRNA(5-methylaminomethyl-2-thiouridylate) methyltransferase|nr:asparagine synthase-related protein [Methanolinea sp.]
MKAGVLFSGGKDSSLAAILLSRDYTVELNTYVFGENRDLSSVERAAEALGLPWKVRVFPPGLLSAAVDSILERGYPAEAITMVHKAALHDLASHYRVVADGTRFDDRVPMLSRDEARSLQDTHGCSYVRPLLGYPRREVDRLAGRYLRVILGETGTLENGDYEVELREAVRARGEDATRFFPMFHEQSLVIGPADTRG